MLEKSQSQKKQKCPSASDNQTSTDLLVQYFKDINEWPETWEIDKNDIKIGGAILEQFKLFLIDRIEKGRAKKTIKSHGNYLWVLGGELIRAVNEDISQRRLSGRNLILKHINDSGGPYWRHAVSEADDAQYDSVCKQLFKFMTNIK